MYGCIQCGKQAAYPGARFCGAACCAMYEAHCKKPTVRMTAVDEKVLLGIDAAIGGRK